MNLPKMTNERIYNIPNALSFYRILVFPLIFYFILHGNYILFAVFLCINLFTDFLDGKIARKFNMVTKFGTKLDSLGDYGTYILAAFGIFKFKTDDLVEHSLIIYTFVFLFVLTQIIHFFRFRIFSSFHLYSFKITGFLQGILFFLWFFVGFYPVYFYIAIGFGIFAELEELTLVFLLKEKRSNVKGLYWILKEKND